MSTTERGKRATLAAMARAKAHQPKQPPPLVWVDKYGEPDEFVEACPESTWCSTCQRAVSMVKMQLATGTWDAHFYCYDCDKRSSNHAIAGSGQWVKGRDVWPHKVIGDRLDSLPERPNKRKAPCSVCGSVEPLEQHHLAPAAVFGEECDRWPTVMVCRSCHQRWHSLMDRA